MSYSETPTKDKCVDCNVHLTRKNFSPWKSNRCRPCTAMYKRKNRVKGPSQATCRDCKLRLTQRTFSPSYPNLCRLCYRLYQNRRWRNNRYGFNDIAYSNLFSKQCGRCAICKKSESLVIDHDHSTGKVRGLLCRKCNIGLGMFIDSQKLLCAAGKYLQNIGTRT
jgi:hypothetical protein